MSRGPRPKPLVWVDRAGAEAGQENMKGDWNLFFPRGTRVAALPGWRNPRLYLPTQGFGEPWKASSFYPASRSTARLYRLLLRSRAAAGLVEVRAARSDGWPLGEFIRDVLPQAVSAVVLVGPHKPNEKLIAQLRNENGEVLGYLKYAEKKVARRRLDREHSILSTLPKDLGPEALKYGTLGNGIALLVTPLFGRSLLTTLPPPEGVTKLLMSYVVSSPVPLEAHPWVQHIRERSRSDRVEVDAWLEALANRHWPVVVQHGDFTPWNLRQSPQGAISAFDWEYGTMEGFPYLDFAYYALQTSFLMHRLAPVKAARRTVRYLINEPRFALCSSEALALVRLSAYAAYHRFLEDGMAPDMGEQPFRRAVWESKASSVGAITKFCEVER